MAEPIRAFARWNARSSLKQAERWEKWPWQMTLWTVALSTVPQVSARFGQAAKIKALEAKVAELERQMNRRRTL